MKRFASGSWTSQEVTGPRRGGRLLAGHLRPVLHERRRPATTRSAPATSARPTTYAGQARARPRAADRHARADAALGRRVPDRTDASGWVGSAVGSHFASLACVLAWGMSAWRRAFCILGGRICAYRAILGLRHSWLSREVLAFGLFAKLATAFVAAESARAGLALWPLVVAGRRCWRPWSSPASCGVGCSVMVYHVVRRPFWRASSSGVKFAGTTVLLGLATALASLAVV